MAVAALQQKRVSSLGSPPGVGELVRSGELVRWFKRLPPEERAAALRLNQWGYRHDARNWIKRFILWGEGEKPTKYQDNIAYILTRNPAHRVVVRSLHGSGKTALAAWLVWWFFCTRDGFVDWKVVTTAGSWNQLIHYLWPEIHKWAPRINWALVGRPMPTKQELLTLALKGKTGEAFAVSTNEAALIEGAHATHIMYIFDEAKAIPTDIWDAAEGAFANVKNDGNSEGYAVAISTPGAPVGRFYEIFAYRDRFKEWWTYHISLNAAIEAGRVSPEWAEARKRNWGEDSALYKNRVLGNFAKTDETAVISLEWVEKANQKWEQETQKLLSKRTLIAVGVDVAWQGSDDSVITPLYDETFVPSQIVVHGDDPMNIVGRVLAIKGLDKTTPIVVDVIGVGAGVAARLRELGYTVIPFNANEKTSERDSTGNFGFVNKRSAAWWRLREALANGELAIPPDDMLLSELIAPKWWVTSSGKIQVESKDSNQSTKGIRARLGRSPDRADSLVYALSYKQRAVGIV